MGVLVVSETCAFALLDHISRMEVSHGKQDLQRYLATLRLDDSNSIEMLADPFPDDFDVNGADEIGLVEDDHIGKADLTNLQARNSVVAAIGKDRLGVNDANDRVESQQSLIPLIQKGHHDTFGIGNSTRLQYHVVDGFFAREEFFERRNEIVANLAAHAAVGKRLRIDDQYRDLPLAAGASDVAAVYTARPGHSDSLQGGDPNE